MTNTTNLYELRKSISKFDSKHKEAQRLTLKQIDKIIATNNYSYSELSKNKKQNNAYNKYMQDVRKIKLVLEGKTEEKKEDENIYLGKYPPRKTSEPVAVRIYTKNEIKIFQQMSQENQDKPVTKQSEINEDIDLSDDEKDNFFVRKLFSGKYSKSTLNKYLHYEEHKSFYKRVKYGKFSDKEGSFNILNLIEDMLDKEKYDFNELVDILKCVNILLIKDLVNINVEDAWDENVWHKLDGIKNPKIKQKLVDLLIEHIIYKIKLGDEKFVENFIYSNRFGQIKEVLKYKHSQLNMTIIEWLEKTFETELDASFTFLNNIVNANIILKYSISSLPIGAGKKGKEIYEMLKK